MGTLDNVEELQGETCGVAMQLISWFTNLTRYGFIRVDLITQLLHCETCRTSLHPPALTPKRSLKKYNLKLPTTIWKDSLRWSKTLTYGIPRSADIRNSPCRIYWCSTKILGVTLTRCNCSKEYIQSVQCLPYYDRVPKSGSKIGHNCAFLGHPDISRCGSFWNFWRIKFILGYSLYPRLAKDSSVLVMPIIGFCTWWMLTCHEYCGCSGSIQWNETCWWLNRSVSWLVQLCKFQIATCRD